VGKYEILNFKTKDIKKTYINHVDISENLRKIQRISKKCKTPFLSLKQIFRNCFWTPPNTPLMWGVRKSDIIPRNAALASKNSFQNMKKFPLYLSSKISVKYLKPEVGARSKSCPPRELKSRSYPVCGDKRKTY
jgi:hypothetical protein